MSVFKTYKKVIVSGFILCLLVPVLCVELGFFIQQKSIKHEVKSRFKRGLRKDQLTFLVFTDVEIETHLNWKHADEFEYNGKMYDVMYAHKEGNITEYWCWADDEENKLYGVYQNLANAALGHSKPYQQGKITLNHFLKNLIFHHFSAFQIQNSNLFKLLSIHLLRPYCSLHIPPPTPPPDFHF